MKAIALKPEQKKIVYAAAAALGVLIVARVFFFGLWKKSKSLNQQIRIEEANFKSGMRLFKQRDQILTENSRYKTYLEFTDSSLDRDIIARFLKELEQLGNDGGISVVNLTPQNQPEKISGARKYNVDLRAEGSEEKILNFLDKIQDSSLLIEVNKLNLAPKDEEAQVLKMDATISISVPTNN